MPTETPSARIAEEIIRRFEGLAATRDRALVEGRQLVRLAANSVRATHRGETAEAERLLAEARGRLDALTAQLRPFPNLYWAGYVQDAAKEVAEAAITLAIVASSASAAGRSPPRRRSRASRRSSLAASARPFR